MYPVVQLEKVIGSVKVETKGLYRHFSCSCRPNTPGKYHLYAKIGAWEWDLGLCVPEDGEFVLRTSIPAKRIPQGEMKFTLAETAVRSDFISVRPHQPFFRLMELKTARLVKQNGQLFVNLSATQDPQGSDQSQEHHCK